MSELVKQAIADTKVKVLEYLKNPTQGQTFAHLMGVLGFEPSPGFTAPAETRRATEVDGLPKSRVLDRALQQLRKERVGFGTPSANGPWLIPPVYSPSTAMPSFEVHQATCEIHRITGKRYPKLEAALANLDSESARDLLRLVRDINDEIQSARRQGALQPWRHGR